MGKEKPWESRRVIRAFPDIVQSFRAERAGIADSCFPLETEDETWERVLRDAQIGGGDGGFGVLGSGESGGK